jgi:GGDEF domain-containing protein
MRFHPWASRTAIVLVMAVLALAPIEALDAVRWIGFCALGAFLIFSLLNRGEKSGDRRFSANPVLNRQSAVLLVEIDSIVNAALSDAERTLVMEAIARSVRAGDTVRSVEEGTFSVQLEGVTPSLATQVGNRICEELSDQIVFDRVGRLISVPISIGGVIGSTDQQPLPVDIAHSNMIRAREFAGQKLLISTAG